MLAPVGAACFHQRSPSRNIPNSLIRTACILRQFGYLSRGAFAASGAQYGTLANTSYSSKAGYRYDPAKDQQ